MQPLKWAQTSPTKNVMAWHLPSVRSRFILALVDWEIPLDTWTTIFRNAYPALIMNPNFSVLILSIWRLAEGRKIALTSNALWAHHLACLILLLQSPACSNTLGPERGVISLDPHNSLLAEWSANRYALKSRLFTLEWRTLIGPRAKQCAQVVSRVSKHGSDWSTWNRGT